MGSTCKGIHSLTAVPPCGVGIVAELMLHCHLPDWLASFVARLRSVF